MPLPLLSWLGTKPSKISTWLCNGRMPKPASMHVKSTRQHDHQRMAQVLEARLSETAEALDTNPSRRLPQRSRKVGSVLTRCPSVPPVLSPSRHRTRGRDTGDGWDTCLQELRQDHPVRLVEDILAEETTCPTAAEGLDADPYGVHIS